MFDDFDTQIQSDEFAWEYEQYLEAMDALWEEPEEWANNPNPTI